MLEIGPACSSHFTTIAEVTQCCSLPNDQYACHILNYGHTPTYQMHATCKMHRRCGYVTSCGCSAGHREAAVVGHVRCIHGPIFGAGIRHRLQIILWTKCWCHKRIYFVLQKVHADAALKLVPVSRPKNETAIRTCLPTIITLCSYKTLSHLIFDPHVQYIFYGLYSVCTGLPEFHIQCLIISDASSNTP